MACSLGYLVFVQDAFADTMSMQEALVELNEAVQFYQVGSSPSITNSIVHFKRQRYPQSIQQEARIYIAEILLVEGNVEGAQLTFTRCWKSIPAITLIDSVTLPKYA